MSYNEKVKKSKSKTRSKPKPKAMSKKETVLPVTPHINPSY